MTGTRVRSIAGCTSGLTRRGFLRASGAAAAGLAFSPWLKHEVASAEAATPAPALTASAWDDLAARLSGHLLRPDDAMYPAAAIINAARYQGTRPEGIAVCVSPEDAAMCVDWVRETGVPFAVRSGGHSYAGFSNSDGLVIDVKGMRSVTVDPATGTGRSLAALTMPTSGMRSRPMASIFQAAAAPRLVCPVSRWGAAGGSVAAISA